MAWWKSGGNDKPCATRKWKPKSPKVWTPTFSNYSAETNHAPRLEEDVEEVAFDVAHPKKCVWFDVALDFETITGILAFLQANMNCFAWSHNDMSSTDQTVITHDINVNPGKIDCKFAADRDRVINKEFQKLLDPGFIKEVQYPYWLANIVVV